MAKTLNAQYRGNAAIAILEGILRDTAPNKTALVSSFGAQSVVLLHMVSMVDRTLPILFIDTQMLFRETRNYQTALCASLGLENIRIVTPRNAMIAMHDPLNDLHQFDPDKYCDLRKSAPLEHALQGFGNWISGRKRFQGGHRTLIEHFEVDNLRLKINPLAHWGQQEIATYIEENRLPKHPLIAKGYASIGCAPCTSPISAGEDPRAGRWRNHAKTECGIHLPSPAPFAPSQTPQNREKASA
ncbi:MAG: phosphoadenylyl-sulfate reductase [Rhodobacterales bacterium]|nr:phosphoadenylyl-sulfate reductase [Rhodobacterales bacterium]